MRKSTLVGELTQQQLKSVLSYDKDAGWFVWTKNASNPELVGTIAGSVSQGYRIIIVHGKAYGAHRLAWLYVNGDLPNLLDHCNGDRDDNRISNLRLATPSQNAANSIKPSNNTSGAKGVTVDALGKFVAQITKDGQTFWLGAYATLDEARAAYIAGAKKHFGEYAHDGERDLHIHNKRKVGAYHPLRVARGHDHKSLTPIRPDQEVWSTKGISTPRMARRVARILRKKEEDAKYLERVMKSAEKQQKIKNSTELIDKK